VLDGGGEGSLIRLSAPGASSAGLGEPVTFEGLVFANAFSSTEARGGAVSIAGRDVTFRFCVFRDNTAGGATSGGGAVRVSAGGRLTVEDSVFEGNRSPNRGAAISAIESEVVVLRSTFTDNRTNVGVHSPRAVGGAIYLLDGELLVQRSRFERNQVGWSGAAIFVFGIWDDAVQGPVSLARIEDSTFLDNVSVPERCCLPPGPSQGGGIHVEDQSRAEVVRSRFERNSGNWGGAISNYRAELDVRDSIFRGNRARLDGDFTGAGGAVIVVSSDILNATVDFGAINRPPATLVASGNLFQGAFGVVGATASQGGCLAALGDTNRQLGEGGIPLDADLGRNRARVSIEDSVFLDCRVEPDVVGNQVFGGALYSNLADLEVSGSMFLGSRAEQGRGGAMVLIESSKADVRDVVFADSYARELGGAIHAAGSELDVRDSVFLRNDVAKSSSALVFEQSGSALLIQPAIGRAEATGTIADNLFAGNPGVVIYEGDDQTPARNLTTYGRNRIVAPAGRKVFLNPLATFAGSNVAELNALVVGRGDGSSTRKSFAPNQAIASAGPFGQVVAAPATVVEDAGPAGDRPAFVGFAWEGGSARLGAVALGERSGALEVAAGGSLPLSLPLVVDGSEEDRVEVGALEASDCPRQPCLDRDRFAVEVGWRDFEGRTGTARPVMLATESDDSAVLWFFAPENWELLIKVLDACGVNDRFWVFAAATTNVEYTLRVTDLATGERRVYGNPLGQRSAAITDTEAFACGGEAGGAPARGASRLETAPARRVRASRGIGSCAPSPTTLCLEDGRFAVRVAWWDFAGETGDAQVVPAGGTDSGLLWFFQPDNWELLVKVLDACALNGSYWVLSAATTNVGYRLTVTDTATGRVVEYENTLGERSPAIVDVEAFATCE
jgi:hypothetical protein